VVELYEAAGAAFDLRALLFGGQNRTISAYAPAPLEVRHHRPTVTHDHSLRMSMAAMQRPPAASSPLDLCCCSVLVSCVSVIIYPVVLV